MSYKLSIGIVGLPNVGKSTLFKHLTAQDIHIANYPFATIDQNVGVVPVPDERLKKLTDISKSKKTVPAVVEFYDIAGLVKGANKGEGLGNQFLTHIRDCKAIVQVVRAFENDEIIHVEGKPDPLRDMETIKTELALKDLETVEKRIVSIDKDIRAGEKSAKHNREILEKVKEKISRLPAQAGNEYVTEFAHEPVINELHLLTAKPQIILLNGSESDVSENVKAEIQKSGMHWLIQDLSSPVSLDVLVRKAYETLGLMSFFTTGEDETRAWTCPKGEKAPQAAGEIHTDFEEKFIRAEVVSCDKLLEAARSASSGHADAWNEAKKKGWVRIEGKDYTMQEGDIMVVRHG